MKSNLLKALIKEDTKTTTENGMKTFSSSLNSNLDLFFMGGAFRNRSEQELVSLFSKAYHEDYQLALMILAYIRDCRGGMGERRFFRIVIKHLAESGNGPFNIHHIPELGRWDDLFVLFNTPFEDETLSIIQKALESKNGLCAKWMPRKGLIANKIREYLELTPKEYRKLLVKLTKVVETQMCNNEWGGINYSHVPSVANVKYNKAFLRHDETRRRDFLAKAIKGEVKINSSVSFPHDIVKMMINPTTWHNRYYNDKGFLTPKRNDTAIAMWNQLPNYMEDSEVKLLPICDTSGSMAGLPLLISLGLGLYISERNEGIFKDAFITFSKTPELQYTKGNLYERLCQIKAIHPANTNLEATFGMLLHTAQKNKLKQKDMPTHLLIISDMEFDQATKPNYNALKMIKKKYKECGYDIPGIIFWNVNSRQNNVPIRFNTEGVALISGASPAVIQAVLENKISPMDIVYAAVNKDRYKAFLR